MALQLPLFNKWINLTEEGKLISPLLKYSHTKSPSSQAFPASSPGTGIFLQSSVQSLKEIPEYLKQNL